MLIFPQRWLYSSVINQLWALYIEEKKCFSVVLIGWNSKERMVPGFDWRIGVISQLTGAKRFGKQPRSYWILIQWICDAYDTWGMGAAGVLGIVIYLSHFSRDFMWYQFHLRYFISTFTCLLVCIHTHNYTHSVQIQTHTDKRAFISAVLFSLLKDHFYKSSVELNCYHWNGKDRSTNSWLMTG